MHCANCGQELKEGSLFCHACGTKVAPKRKTVNFGVKLDPKHKGILLTIAGAVAVCVLGLVLIGGGRADKYEDALEAMEQGNYQTAIAAFDELGDYQDAEKQLQECRYGLAMQLLEEGDYEAAEEILLQMPSFRDAGSLLTECQYLRAKDLLDRDAYDEARELFSELGDYKDSGDMEVDSRYRLAMEMMEKGAYEAARDAFNEIVTYQDAVTMAMECEFLWASELLEAGEYETAAVMFGDLCDYKESGDLAKEAWYQYAITLSGSGDLAGALEKFGYVGDYKDARKHVDDCRYRIALEHYERKDYEKTLEALEGLEDKFEDTGEIRAVCCYYRMKAFGDKKNYEECFGLYKLLEKSSYLPKDLDISFVEDLKDDYVEELIASGETEALLQAITVLHTMGDTKETQKRISEVEDKLNQKKYEEGKAQLSKKEYLSAIFTFEDILDYKDAKTQWLTAMYEYVVANKDKTSTGNSLFGRLQNLLGTDETVEKYAKILADNRFKDGKAIYKELTAWEVEISMNNDVDTETGATCVSKYDTIYAHLKLSGGPKDGKTKLKYTFIMPDGGRTSGKFDWEWEAGDSSWCCCYYNDPSRGKGGTCYVKIYDGEGNLIGEDQIRVMS